MKVAVVSGANKVRASRFYILENSILSRIFTFSGHWI
jgi:hypothetical protein